jgi:D-lyxose ketol-isomerase
MKRSVINTYIREAGDFLSALQYALPPFAWWSPDEWKNKGPEYDEIRDNQLGWDLTDFGSADYERVGLLLFTIRNGRITGPREKPRLSGHDCLCPAGVPANQQPFNTNKPYAEKILIVKPGQITPLHFHKSKVEDIINRGGGGVLQIQLYGSVGERTVDTESDVPVSIDGRNYAVQAGTVVSLKTGESITLRQGIFHQFWAEGAMLLLGEVSMVNDDRTDNFFRDDVGRFPDIEEDEKPLHLLVGDYTQYR